MLNKKLLFRLYYWCREDNSHIWKYVNSLEENYGCPRSLYSGYKYADNDQEIADLFPNYFSSVYERHTDK